MNANATPANHPPPGSRSAVEGGGAGESGRRWLGCDLTQPLAAEGELTEALRGCAAAVRRPRTPAASPLRHRPCFAPAAKAAGGCVVGDSRGVDISPVLTVILTPRRRWPGGR